MEQMLNPQVFATLIPIVAIIMGGTYAIAKAFMRHKERLAMIERGMHPDLPHEDAGEKLPLERR
jgi:hypothetical protein